MRRVRGEEGGEERFIMPLLDSSVDHLNITWKISHLHTPLNNTSPLRMSSPGLGVALFSCYYRGSLGWGGLVAGTEN